MTLTPSDATTEELSTPSLSSEALSAEADLDLGPFRPGIQPGQADHPLAQIEPGARPRRRHRGGNCNQQEHPRPTVSGCRCE